MLVTVGYIKGKPVTLLTETDSYLDFTQGNILIPDEEKELEMEDVEQFCKTHGLKKGDFNKRLTLEDVNHPEVVETVIREMDEYNTSHGKNF